MFTAVGGGKGIHYAVWDRGQAAGVVKIEAIPVAAGLGEELMKQQQQHVEDERLVYLDNQGLHHVAGN